MTPAGAGDAVIRAFAAIELPEAVREALAACQDDLRRAGARVTWTNPSNLHLTLRFLGDVPRDHLEALSLALDETAREHPPLDLAVATVGSFGSRGRPSVLWAGCSGAGDRLARMQKSLERAFADLGHPGEARPFHAHVTLGRLRPGRDAGSLTSRIDSFRNAAFGSFRAEEIVLVRSELSPQGPRYTALHRSGLKGA